jgi:hypothetical protein
MTFIDANNLSGGREVALVISQGPFKFIISGKQIFSFWKGNNALSGAPTWFKVTKADYRISRLC